MIDGDTAFPLLLREVVAPAGIAGLVGLVAAGLIGAILSSVDSMMNSAATLITFDIYKRYINPEASDHQLIKIGRILIGVMVVGCALLTVLVFDPNTKQLFFTYVASHQSKLVGGVVVAFAVGMLWKGATAAGGFASIITGVIVSYAIIPIYSSSIGKIEFFENIKKINCYSNEENIWKKSEINFINNQIIKIKLQGKFIGERGRINCSLREDGGFWRWLGIQFVIAKE